MKTIKLLIVALCLLFMINNAYSQRTELGIHLGGVNYVGDLVTTQISPKEAQSSFGLSTRYYINSTFSVKANFMYGKLVGSDANYPDDKDRYKRNLSFHSHIVDAAFTFELDLVSFFDDRFDMVYRRRDRSLPLSLYVYAGVGVFNFKPKTMHDGVEYELRDMQTEMNKPQYALTQISIPHGVGIAWKVSKGWAIGLDVSYRMTFTDYLDDVSGLYANCDALTGEGRELEACLSDRTYEITGEFADREGVNRGNPDRNDGFVYTSVIISKNFDGLFGTPGYKGSRHKRYKGGRYKPGKGYRKIYR